MPIGHSGYYIPAALVIWLEFFMLLIVAILFVQVLHLESAFQAKRTIWLKQIRQLSRQVRQGRLQVENIPVIELFNLIQPLFRGIWKPAFWVLRSVATARSARP